MFKDDPLVGYFATGGQVPEGVPPHLAQYYQIPQDYSHVESTVDPKTVNWDALQNSEYMKQRRQDAVDMHNKMAQVGNSTIGRIVKPFIDTTLNNVTGGAFGAVKTGLQTGSWSDALTDYGKGYVGNYIGDHITTGIEHGINPFGEQSRMLTDQAAGFGSDNLLASMTGDFAGNVVKTEGNLEKAALRTAGDHALDYLKDSGTGMNFQTPEILKDFDRNIIRPVGDALAPAVGAVGDMLDPIYQAQKPIGQAVADIGTGIYEAQKPIGQAVADTLDPLYQAQKPIGQAVADTLEPVVDQLKETADKIANDPPSIDLGLDDWGVGDVKEFINGVESGGAPPPMVAPNLEGTLPTGGGRGSGIFQQDPYQSPLVQQKKVGFMYKEGLTEDQLYGASSGNPIPPPDIPPVPTQLPVSAQQPQVGTAPAQQLPANVANTSQLYDPNQVIAGSGTQIQFGGPLLRR